MPLCVDEMDPLLVCVTICAELTIMSNYGTSCIRSEYTREKETTCLNRRIINITLHIPKLQLLLKHDLHHPATPRPNLTLDPDAPRSPNRDRQIPTRTYTSPARRLRILFHLVLRDVSRCRRVGGVELDLEKAGDVPVRVDGVVGLGGDDVEGYGVWGTVGKDRNEGS